MLVDVSETSTATEVLGHELAMPLLIAPTAFLRMAHRDGEKGVARAAAAAGTVYCLSTFATASPAEIAEAAPGGTRWFQLYCYRDRSLTHTLMQQAAESGFSAIVVTIDVPFLGRRERDLRTGFSLPADVEVPSFAAAGGGGAATPAEILAMLDPGLTWKDVEDIAGATSLPVLVKGVLTEEDARLAVEHGAAGVVVSNHGGRQLDGVPASLDALPEVVEAVEGRVPVLMDGGVRRGTDVVKALALGARAVLIGRPAVWGLAAGGEAGVAHVLELLREEVRLALSLLGCPTPGDVGPEHVSPRRD
jgi:4-hydroxymandelate oxidase